LISHRRAGRFLSKATDSLSMPFALKMALGGGQCGFHIGRQLDAVLRVAIFLQQLQGPQVDRRRQARSYLPDPAMLKAMAAGTGHGSPMQ
jgi:hypothetical protein